MILKRSLIDDSILIIECNVIKKAKQKYIVSVKIITCLLKYKR